MNKRGNIEIEMSKVNPKIRKGKSMKVGSTGVFAKGTVKKGEILVVYGGYVMTTKEFNSLSVELKEFAYHLSDELLFGPIRKKDIGIGEYFNHCCNPNAGFKDCITLVAMKDIHRNQEVTFDYATCMTSDILNLECCCGESNCRKKITGNDWKNKGLQKKYRGYFLPYIQEKIDKLKNKK